MMRIKTILLSAWLIAALSAAGFAQAAENMSTWDQIQKSGVVRVGCANSEPWYYKDPATGKWSGIGPGITELLAEDLGVEWECVETTWGNAVAGLQANQFDMMVALDATPKRALSIDFPNGTLLYYAVGVLAQPNMKVVKWSEMNNPDTQVAVPLGTSNDRAISAMLPDAKFERTKGSAEAIASFAAGRADVVGGGVMWLMMQNRALGGQGQVIIPKPASASTTSVGVRREDDKRWRDWLGVAIDFYYHRGKTVKVYEDFLVSRGIDPATAPGIKLEDMQ